MNGGLPAGNSGGVPSQATPSIRKPVPYRGYTLQRGLSGIEIRWGSNPDLITIEATFASAQGVIDDWLWAK